MNGSDPKTRGCTRERLNGEGGGVDFLDCLSGIEGRVDLSREWGGLFSKGGCSDEGLRRRKKQEERALSKAQKFQGWYILPRWAGKNGRAKKLGTGSFYVIEGPAHLRRSRHLAVFVPDHRRAEWGGEKIACSWDHKKGEKLRPRSRILRSFGKNTTQERGGVVLDREKTEKKQLIVAERIPRGRMNEAARLSDKVRTFSNPC